MLWTPLEQFQIISLFSIKLLCLDLSVTNLMLINIIILVFFSTVVFFFSSNPDCLGKISFFIIPNAWQVLIESVCEWVAYKRAQLTIFTTHHFFTIVALPRILWMTFVGVQLFTYLLVNFFFTIIYVISFFLWIYVDRSKIYQSMNRIRSNYGPLIAQIIFCAGDFLAENHPFLFVDPNPIQPEEMPYFQRYLKPLVVENVIYTPYILDIFHTDLGKPESTWWDLSTFTSVHVVFAHPDFNVPGYVNDFNNMVYELRAAGLDRFFDNQFAIKTRALSESLQANNSVHTPETLLQEQQIEGLKTKKDKFDLREVIRMEDYWRGDRLRDGDKTQKLLEHLIARRP